MERFDTFNVIRKITRTQCIEQHDEQLAPHTKWFRCIKCVCRVHYNFAFSLLIRTHGDRIAEAFLSFVPDISLHQLVIGLDFEAEIRARKMDNNKGKIVENCITGRIRESNFPAVAIFATEPNSWETRRIAESIFTSIHQHQTANRICESKLYIFFWLLK